MWAERILELQKQLVQARRVTEKLCASLEAPGSKDRWVELGGEDPDLESLSARVSGLEMRVGSAREELLERELVLEEISGLAARLKASAAAAAATAAPAGGAGAATAKPGSATAALTAPEPPALAAAKQATELQSKIKELNRKMMAVVSELSMYQATAIKLASEATRAGETLSAAEAAAAKGLPPSVTAEQRWQSILKAMMQAPGVGAAKPCVISRCRRCNCAICFCTQRVVKRRISDPPLHACHFLRFAGTRHCSTARLQLRKCAPMLTFQTDQASACQNHMASSRLSNRKPLVRGCVTSETPSLKSWNFESSPLFHDDIFIIVESKHHITA